MSFARASAAQSLAQDGTSNQQSAVDVPRFQGVARRLLVEGPRTNALRNPRTEGGTDGVVGSGGTMPTNWTAPSGGGITVERVGSVTVDGVQCLRLRVTGTATATVSLGMVLEGPTVIAAANGQVWTHSVFARRYAALGTGNAPGLAVRTNTRTSAGAMISTSSGTSMVEGTPLTRYSRSVTITDATAAYIQPLVSFAIVSGTIYDAAFDIGWPQMEQAGFASSPVLPLAGTPAAATRAADIPTIALSAAFPQRGTLVGTFMLPQAAPAGVDLGLLQLDDGSDSNRILLRGVAGGSTIGALTVSGGSVTATLAGAAVTVGTPFRAALAWGAGSTAMCLAGGTVQSAATLPSGLARLLIGHATTGLARAAFGEIGPLDLHSTRLPDATLQALTL